MFFKTVFIRLLKRGTASRELSEDGAEGEGAPSSITCSRQLRAPSLPSCTDSTFLICAHVRVEKLHVSTPTLISDTYNYQPRSLSCLGFNRKPTTDKASIGVCVSTITRHCIRSHRSFLRYCATFIPKLQNRRIFHWFQFNFFSICLAILGNPTICIFLQSSFRRQIAMHRELPSSQRRNYEKPERNEGDVDLSFVGAIENRRP